MEPEEPQGSLHVIWCPNFTNNTPLEICKEYLCETLYHTQMGIY